MSEVGRVSSVVVAMDRGRGEGVVWECVYDL